MDKIKIPKQLLRVDIKKVNGFCNNTEKFVLVGCCPRPLGLLDELAKHIHSPPLSKPNEGSVSYEPFYDDLTQDEQIELAQAMN